MPHSHTHISQDSHSNIATIFREYDIRGIFDKELKADVVFNIGRLLAEEILHTNLPPMVHIGYDARVHSPTLFEWLKAGFVSKNVQVYHLGMIPTPVAYFATFNTIDGITCPHSVMITGSHNPPQYNGFKITINQMPFYGQSIQRLGQKLLSTLSQNPYPKDLNASHLTLNALESYTQYLSNAFQSLKDFPYPVAIDCGNGVGSLGIESVLKKLNITYTPLYFKPDGTFPNHHPDPSEEENLRDLQDLMKSDSIPIGIAFDGDADRLALLTKDYHYKGDELAILFAREMKKHYLNPIVIGEVKCSQVMYDEINKIGKALMYKTGHSNLKVKLKEENAHLAAEMSGHIFFNDRYFGYDDAIYSALRALELFLSFTPEELEKEILALPRFYSTPEEKISTTDEQKFALIDALAQKLDNPPKDFPKIIDIIRIDGLRVVFENGWGLLRASNTTPVLVSRFEAKTQEDSVLYQQKLLALLEECRTNPTPKA